MNALVRLAHAVEEARDLLAAYAQTEMEEAEVVALLHPVVKVIAEAFLEAHDEFGRELH